MRGTAVGLIGAAALAATGLCYWVTEGFFGRSVSPSGLETAVVEAETQESWNGREILLPPEKGDLLACDFIEIDLGIIKYTKKIDCHSPCCPTSSSSCTDSAQQKHVHPDWIDSTGPYNPIPRNELLRKAVLACYPAPGRDRPECPLCPGSGGYDGNGDGVVEGYTVAFNGPANDWMMKRTPDLDRVSLGLGYRTASIWKAVGVPLLDELA